MTSEFQDQRGHIIAALNHLDHVLPGQVYFPVPKTPSERVRPLRPSIGGMVVTASTSFSLMCRPHIFP